MEESGCAEDGAKITPIKFPLPEPVVMQSGQVISPFPSKETTPDAETATVPLAFGILIVLFPEDGVLKVKVLVTPPDEDVSEVIAPCNVRFWL